MTKKTPIALKNPQLPPPVLSNLWLVERYLIRLRELDEDPGPLWAWKGDVVEEVRDEPLHGDLVGTHQDSLTTHKYHFIAHLSYLIYYNAIVRIYVLCDIS